MLVGSRLAIREQYKSVTAIRDADNLKELLAGADKAAAAQFRDTAPDAVKWFLEDRKTPP